MILSSLVIASLHNHGLSPFPHAETDKRLKAPLEPLWLKAGWTIERITEIQG